VVDGSDQHCHGIETVHVIFSISGKLIYRISRLYRNMKRRIYLSSEPSRLAITGDDTMTRLAIPELETAPDASRGTLDAVHKQLGVVPNMFRLLAISPNALGAFMGLSAGAAKLLDVKTRERIALAVAQVNGCDYCLSAHTYLGLNLARISPEEIALNRKGDSSDPRAAAAVRFAANVARERGHVGEEAVNEVRAAGYSDAEIVEIVLVVAENILTNLLNIVADTEIDFPVVRAAEAA
jgi:uncharacterized peroxidase-related enzyme